MTTKFLRQNFNPIQNFKFPLTIRKSWKQYPFAVMMLNLMEEWVDSNLDECCYYSFSSSITSSDYTISLLFKSDNDRLIFKLVWG